MNSVVRGKIHVLIADDHGIVRKGLIQVLSKTEDMVVCGEAENGNEVLELVKNVKADVVVMDIDMPEKSGWETLVQLKIQTPELPIIILSIYSEDHYALRFLRAGASGYLTKSSAPELLVDALRKVSAGGKYISPSLAEKLAFNLDSSSDKLPHETLTDREFQVFCQIAAGKKLKEIADELALGITTVSTHRGNILAKMGMKNNADIIQYALKNGII
ncbi:response regulator [Nitrospina gracilis]|uniref:response regulator n=1 Tax=Nitrospina gracilis TaxID=35801 RepID=UPI001F2C9FF6|nr:response regulator transcription factor [Nitrospina gracilis]MCF8719470.1 DNA-binding NarL/FixJ family response regulator [Nitrospina gracilis Nb-211]